MKTQFYGLFLLATTAFAQPKRTVDFISLDAQLQPNFATKSIAGNLTFVFEVNAKTDSIFIDAKDMVFEQLQLNGKLMPFVNNGKQLVLYKGYKKGKNTLKLSYSAQPKQTMYFVGTPKNHQIWTQGQGKYTSHWLPSFDDANEKLIFNLGITYPAPYQVISNGILEMKMSYGSKNSWQYHMEKPMSSYLAMIAIGDYAQVKQFSKSGIPLELYVKSSDLDKVNTTYKDNQALFDVLEKRIGFPYPWGVYKQVPLEDFLYAGMENTSATTFSQDFVVDHIGIHDKSYTNVNAHELAHQWFGDLVTAKEGKHHWLQEGFATFYALTAEGELYGADFEVFEWYEMLEELLRAKKTDKQVVLDAKASSLTFYKKGAWALYALRAEVGSASFDLAVRNYLKKYAFKTVETSDFLNEIKEVSSCDVEAFQRRWLESSEFPVAEALALLKKNVSMVHYLELGGLYDQPFEEHKAVFEQILKSSADRKIKEEVIYQMGKQEFELIAPLALLVLDSKDVHLRQALIRSLGKVPDNFKSQYATFLEDPSYITREIALQNLWSQYASERGELLDKTQDWIGFNDRNLRITWLTLALATQDYKQTQKPQFYDELLQYTTADYNAAIRQNAINNLLFLDKNDQNILQALVEGTLHHKWQFVKYCKDTIRQMLKKTSYQVYFNEMLPKLTPAEQQSLVKLLKEI